MGALIEDALNFENNSFAETTLSFVKQLADSFGKASVYQAEYDASDQELRRKLWEALSSREGLEQLRSEFASYFDEGAKGDGDAPAASRDGQVSNASPGSEPPEPTPSPTLSESERKKLYDANGNYTGGRTQEELDSLANDPSRGSVRPDDIAQGAHERKIGLELEERGELSGIVRDTSGDAEFIESNGQAWDIKSFNSNYSPRKGGYTLRASLNIIFESLNKNENVILDVMNLIPEHCEELLSALKELGLMDHIIVWP